MAAIAFMLAVTFSALAQDNSKTRQEQQQTKQSKEIPQAERSLKRTAFVPVAAIIDIPDTVNLGAPLTLTGKVIPAKATNQTINWSIVSAGTTGAKIKGITLYTKAEGTVKVRATIKNGASVSSNYIQDFAITVNTLVEIQIPIQDWRSVKDDEPAPTSQIEQTD